MADIDIQESLISAIYTRLTTDTTLKSKMGGTVRLYLNWAQPDTPFPYLVHRIDMSNVADWSPQRKCTYYLDIWSYSTTAEECLDIKFRILALIDDYRSSTSETTEYFIWLQTDGFIPESEEDIWHYALQFNLKWLRDSQIGTLLYR